LMRRLTERRAYLAAKQLAHHRERLPWMRERMEENVMWTVRPPRLPTKTSYTSCSVPLEHSGRSV
jgi:hypothetical protein